MLILPTQGKDFLRRCCTYFGIGGALILELTAEVQNLEGRSIRGLYAAGNAAGGLFFRNYIGGAQFGGATVFGRIAGREMAHRAQELANK